MPKKKKGKFLKALPEDQWMYPSEIKEFWREGFGITKERARIIWDRIQSYDEIERKQPSEIMTGTFKYRKVSD